MSTLIVPLHGRGTINRYEKGDKVSDNVGRKKSLVKLWNEQNPKESISKEDMDRSYTTILDSTKDDLKTLSANKDAPMALRIAARNLLKDRGFQVMEIMLDRAQGTARQNIDHTTGGKPFQIQTVNYGDNHDTPSVSTKAVSVTDPKSEG